MILLFIVFVDVVVEAFENACIFIPVNVVPTVTPPLLLVMLLKLQFIL